MEANNKLNNQNQYNLYKQKLINIYNEMNMDTKEIIDINDNLINIINKITTFEHYLDYEYLISIIKENFNKLMFLGKKRNNNTTIQNISPNENKLKNFIYINKNDMLTNINNHLEQQSNILNNCTNNEKNNFKEKEINYENIKNIINNNNVNINGFRLNNNNEINNAELSGNIKKVIKNRKTVYINKLFDKKITKIKKREGKGKRTSKYRGVSQNGIGWQAIMMCKRSKPYIGTFNSEEIAARIYDIVSIKKKGIKSKTNFLYNNEQIKRILQVNINFKDPNIEKVISDLIK